MHIIRILKTGVGIHEDAKRILQYLVVDEMNGIVDLAYSFLIPLSRSVVAQFMGHTDLKTSLQYLTEKYLNIYISKGITRLSVNTRSRGSLWKLGSAGTERRANSLRCQRLLLLAGIIHLLLRSIQEDMQGRSSFRV